MFRPALRNTALVVFKREAPYFHHNFSKPFSSTISDVETTPVIKYLVQNCGLSSKSALSASKKIKLKTTEKLDLVIRILRDHRFSDGQIASAITKHPQILSLKATKKSGSVLQLLRDYGFSSKQVAVAVTKFPLLLLKKPEINLKPKLEFLRHVGFKRSELADIFSTNPILFNFSLEKTMIPSFDFMKTYLPSRTVIINFLKNGDKFLLPEKAPNIEILRSRGVPEDVILKMFMKRPRSLLKNVGTFAQAVDNVEKFGLQPTSPMFIRAIDVLCYMTKSTWERKVDLYKSLGWSDGQIRAMFARTPYCFAFSDELIKKKMRFFLEKLAWSPEFVAHNPVILQFSLEKRIVPRCSVLNILMSKGFIKKKATFRYPLLLSDKLFSNEYVKKYEKEVPEVVQAYEREIDFKGWT